MNIEQDSIQVVIRVRPGQTNPFLTLSDTNILLGNSNFTFDRIFLPDACQTEVYMQTGRKQIEHTLQGYNSCLFVYGQTGSGKTHTMIGENNGIVQQSLRHLFTRIAENFANEYQITCSYFEIYNQQIFDLLDTTKQKKLSIREDIKKGVFVQGLTEEGIVSMEEGIARLNQGIRARHVGETLMNRQSSRSHAIYSLTVLSKLIQNGSSILKKSKIHFVDLAGSERQKSTAAIGDRLKEASNINRSLTTLGMVINCLSGDKSNHVPFRNSKLTFVLRDSLGGNSKTFLIATIADNEASIQQTLSTLKFAQRAKLVKLNALINEQSLSLNVDVLKSQIRRLKDELARVNHELEQEKQKKSSTPYNNVVVNSYSKSMDHFNDKINCLLDLIPKLLDKEPVEHNVEEYLKNNNEMLSSMSESLSKLIELKNEVRAKASLEKLRLEELQPFKSVSKLMIRRDQGENINKLELEKKEAEEQIHILLKQQEDMKVQTDRVLEEKNEEYLVLLNKYENLQNKTFEAEESNSNLILQLEIVKNKLLSFEEKVNLDGRLIEDYQNRLSCSGVEIEQLRSEVAELNQNLVKNGKNHRHQLEEVLAKWNEQEREYNQSINQLNHQCIAKDEELAKTVASYEQRVQGVTQQFMQIRDQNFLFQSQLVSSQTQIASLVKQNDYLKKQSLVQNDSNLSLTQKISTYEETVLHLKGLEERQIEEIERERLKHSEQILELQRNFSNQTEEFKEHQKLKEKCNELIVENYKLKNTGRVQENLDNTEITSKLDYYEEKFNLMKIEYSKSIETIRLLKQREILIKEENMKLVNTLKDFQLERQISPVQSHVVKYKQEKRIEKEKGKENNQNICSSVNTEQLKRMISRLDSQSTIKGEYEFEDLLLLLEQTIRNKESKIKKEVEKETKLKSQNYLILKQNLYLKERIRNIEQPSYAVKTPSKKQKTG